MGWETLLPAAIGLFTNKGGGDAPSAASAPTQTPDQAEMSAFIKPYLTDWMKAPPKLQASPLAYSKINYGGNKLSGGGGTFGITPTQGMTQQTTFIPGVTPPGMVSGQRSLPTSQMPPQYNTQQQGQTTPNRMDNATPQAPGLTDAEQTVIRYSLKADPNAINGFNQEQIAKTRAGGVGMTYNPSTGSFTNFTPDQIAQYRNIIENAPFQSQQANLKLSDRFITGNPAAEAGFARSMSRGDNNPEAAAAYTKQLNSKNWGAYTSVAQDWPQIMSMLDDGFDPARDLKSASQGNGASSNPAGTLNFTYNGKNGPQNPVIPVDVYKKLKVIADNHSAYNGDVPSYVTSPGAPQNTAPAVYTPQQSRGLSGYDPNQGGSSINIPLIPGLTKMAGSQSQFQPNGGPPVSPELQKNVDALKAYFERNPASREKYFAEGGGESDAGKALLAQENSWQSKIAQLGLPIEFTKQLQDLGRAMDRTGDINQAYQGTDRTGDINQAYGGLADRTGDINQAFQNIDLTDLINRAYTGTDRTGNINDAYRGLTDRTGDINQAYQGLDRNQEITDAYAPITDRTAEINRIGREIDPNLTKALGPIQNSLEQLSEDKIRAGMDRTLQEGYGTDYLQMLAKQGLDPLKEAYDDALRKAGIDYNRMNMAASGFEFGNKFGQQDDSITRNYMREVGKVYDDVALRGAEAARADRFTNAGMQDQFVDRGVDLSGRQKEEEFRRQVTNQDMALQADQLNRQYAAQGYDLAQRQELIARDLSQGKLTALTNQDLTNRDLSQGRLQALNTQEMQDRLMSQGRLGALTSQDALMQSLAQGKLGATNEQELMNRQLMQGRTQALTDQELRNREMSQGRLGALTSQDALMQSLAQGKLGALTDQDIRNRELEARSLEGLQKEALMNKDLLSKQINTGMTLDQQNEANRQWQSGFNVDQMKYDQEAEQAKWAKEADLGLGLADREDALSKYNKEMDLKLQQSNIGYQQDALKNIMNFISGQQATANNMQDNFWNANTAATNQSNADNASMAELAKLIAGGIGGGKGTPPIVPVKSEGYDPFGLSSWFS